MALLAGDLETPAGIGDVACVDRVEGGLEEVGALEKEGTLFGKEQGETEAVTAGSISRLLPVSAEAKPVSLAARQSRQLKSRSSGLCWTREDPRAPS